MKLYIKQKVFSWRDKFFIKNESGKDKYYAKAEFFSMRGKLHLFDENNREIALLQRKLFTFLPKIQIAIKGRSYLLVKEFSFFRPKFRLEGSNWNMDGEFLSHEYTLTDSNTLIMSISKKWFTWGDSYELDIPNPENELLCLCVALGVDMTSHNGSKSSSHNN